ncbi:MAG: cytidylate kinase-like family protein [Chloroflexi bacterium]|nr:cytidylate kinase-like family protein [Chloroflexota bacterium]
MPVITIARQYGAGARIVGKMVADALKIGYVDKELISAAAQRLGTSPDALAKRDERPKPLRERISRMLQTFLEKSAVAGSAGDPFLGPTGMEMLLSRGYPESAEPAVTEEQEIDDKRFIAIVRTIIADLAAAGNVVIIGRGASIILRDKPEVLKVRLVAPLDFRVKTIMEVDGVSAKAAEKQVIETEQQRAAFIRKFFKADVASPLLYHLTINTGLVSFQQATRMIIDAAKTLESG